MYIKKWEKIIDEILLNLVFSTSKQFGIVGVSRQGRKGERRKEGEQRTNVLLNKNK